ncbi:MAG TPA: Ig-like domain-containing protein, partial [Candidatus Limnocylindria bacterium]
PASAFSQAALSRWGVVADLLAPTAAGSPRRGAEMVPAKSGVRVAFSEPVNGLSGATVQLRVNDVPLAANVTSGAGGANVGLTPLAPLPVNATVRLWLSSQLRDRAGNPLSTDGWGFQTAPGTVFAPSRAGRLAQGAQQGYAIAQDGDLLRAQRVMLGNPRSFSSAQRATLPNLPGRWLLAESGPLAGRWVRESARAQLRGVVERVAYPEGVQLRLQPAVHVGRSFTAGGDVRATRSMTVGATASVGADARAFINGQPYWRIRGGRLDGFWLAESALAFLPGSIDRLGLPAAPLLDLAAGSYTGYRYSDRGTVIGKESVRYGSARSIAVTAWKVVNGRAHFLVASGALAGTWLPESSATRLHV